MDASGTMMVTQSNSARHTCGRWGAGGGKWVVGRQVAERGGTRWLAQVLVLVLLLVL
jgi:hypothetical protein